jgi:hypothetical protein
MKCLGREDCEGQGECVEVGEEARGMGVGGVEEYVGAGGV